MVVAAAKPEATGRAGSQPARPAGRANPAGRNIGRPGGVDRAQARRRPGRPFSPGRMGRKHGERRPARGGRGLANARPRWRARQGADCAGRKRSEASAAGPDKAPFPPILISFRLGRAAARGKGGPGGEGGEGAPLPMIAHGPGSGRRNVKPVASLILGNVVRRIRGRVASAPRLSGGGRPSDGAAHPCLSLSRTRARFHF